jgi:hypothetical protein
MESSTKLLLVSIICVLIYWFYKWGTKNNNYFKERGIKFQAPAFLFGNNLAAFRRKSNVLDFLMKDYFEFPEER